jgi:hypothetical protein
MVMEPKFERNRIKRNETKRNDRII